MIKTILLGPSKLFLESLCFLLQNEANFEITYSVFHADFNINQIPFDTQLIVIDTKIHSTKGYNEIKSIKKNFKNSKLLLLVDQLNASHIKKMLSFNVDGYLLHDIPKSVLIDSILLTFLEEKHYDERCEKFLLQSYQSKKKEVHSPLSEREKEVVKHISEGLNATEIAEQMVVSKSTIESHRKNIYLKLGFNKVALLVRYAFDHEIID